MPRSSRCAADNRCHGGWPDGPVALANFQTPRHKTKAPMTQDRVMLLIDADNVSIDVMEQAVRLLLNQHGGLHVRRAYCTAESAVKHQPAFKRLGIKPMVNLAAGKNSTDIALAVDAIDL